MPIFIPAVLLLLATNFVVVGELRWTFLLQAVVRWAIIITASYLLAARRPGWRGALRSAGAAVAITTLAVFLEVSVYVLTGRAAADRRGPALVLAILMMGPICGLAGGLAGAGASEIRRRLRHKHSLAQ